MATYPGMSLGGEVRESVSLDEDDLSDVEDEVFIRDGKNGYKFAEDIGVKRPLMAPRRKIIKPDFRSRLKYGPSWCRWCKPICFVFAILVTLIGVLALCFILISMFPLPVAKIKNWITTKTHKNVTVKLLPCSDLNVTDVWSTSLPKLTSESSIRSVDIDVDGVMDVIFGFGTGDNSALHPDIFCPMFMGVASPCGGGLIALNGANGKIIWKKHLAHTIFTVFCSADLNSDSVFDCIAAGKGGILIAVNAKNGDILWEFNDKNKDNQLIMDLYTPNFVPDQNNDGVDDIIAAHTSEKGMTRTGHIFLISGKNGDEIRCVSTPNGIETYYIPQLLPQKNGQYKILFGTGSPTSAGNLTVFDLKELVNKSSSVNFETVYEDKYKGVLTPSILVDITGDKQVDIITAMFNSTVVAIDGATFKQIWNITVNDSETLSIPTPGYFNADNVTDFLIKYQTGPEFPIYYYSQVYIIDGKTGKFIYDSPIVDTSGSQMGGLTLSMEGYGNDFFVYWMSDCKFYEGRQDAYEFLPGSDLKDQSNSDLCKLRFNSTKTTKMFALNQFEQPPGLEIYSSENKTLIEFNNTKTPTEEATEYLKKHPEVQVGESEQRTPSSEVVEIYKQAPEPIKNIKYKDGSSFRHKDNNQGLIKDYSKSDKNKVTDNFKDDFDSTDYDQSSNWRQNYQNYLPGDIDDNYETLNMYNPNNQMIINDAIKNTNRDTRGDGSPEPIQKSSKKNLSDNKYNIFNYDNVREARNRILNDLNSVPNEILRDTFLKNREQELRKSRLEQRDLNSHIDKLQEKEEMQKVLVNEEKKLVNVSENLWDLESEKELEERKNGYWRGKRGVDNLNIKGIQKITSLGTLVKAVGVKNKNAVDLIFLTYWLPPKNGPQILIDKDYDCIAAKLKNDPNSKDGMVQSEKLALENLYKKECLEERLPVVKEIVENSNFPYFNQMSRLRLGQMTVYKIRLECLCDAVGSEEKCAKFLDPEDTKGWTEYLGRHGDGIFSRS